MPTNPLVRKILTVVGCLLALAVAMVLALGNSLGLIAAPSQGGCRQGAIET